MWVVVNCHHLAKLTFSPVLPNTFAEHGAIMAANVLNSKQAAAMLIFIVLAFVKMREVLLDRAELEKRLAGIGGRHCFDNADSLLCDFRS